ncbi:putative DUF3669 domain-containing protein [Seiridium unicorne]|uniref:DUF3669 domain-containing protein n=1 Tax=Seiridium unicorne TaxID=138068 RepID=A0ABR2UXQ8_9PEZI
MEYAAFHREGQSSTSYRRVGFGFCGSVWSNSDHEVIDSTSTAIKREDGGPGRSLFNDFDIHTTLILTYQDCALQIRSSFQIPKCHGFVPGSYSGWNTTKVLGRFPSGYTPCNILITQRIPPVSEQARQTLLDRYCPQPLIQRIKADANNTDCLVRPYLGRRKLGQQESKVRAFSLRNYPLHVNQMMDLELDVPNYATAIARALAFIHWAAKIDANDVEFVLGSAPDGDIPQFQSKYFGGHSLWILDFDCCKRMSMDEQGVQRGAEAFLQNDPFYPRPGKDNQEDMELWGYFRAAYEEASSFISQTDSQVSERLPRLLMDTIERIVQDRKLSS